jgi:hypothetical protein
MQSGGMGLAHAACLQVLEAAAPGAVRASRSERQRQGCVVAQDVGSPGAQSHDTPACIGVAMKRCHRQADVVVRHGCKRSFWRRCEWAAAAAAGGGGGFEERCLLLSHAPQDGQGATRNFRTIFSSESNSGHGLIRFKECTQNRYIQPQSCHRS